MSTIEFSARASWPLLANAAARSARRQVLLIVLRQVIVATVIVGWARLLWWAGRQYVGS